MHVRRYVPPFEVYLERQSFEDWGFIFRASTPASDIQELLVQEVMPDGRLALHNFQQAASGLWESMVMPMMRITAVNGVEGDAQAMLDLLDKLDRVKLRVGPARRPHVKPQCEVMRMMSRSDS